MLTNNIYIYIYIYIPLIMKTLNSNLINSVLKLIFWLILCS